MNVAPPAQKSGDDFRFRKQPGRCGKMGALAGFGKRIASRLSFRWCQPLAILRPLLTRAS